MAHQLTVDGKEAEILISDQELKINRKTRQEQETTIDFDDVIAVETNDLALNAETDQSKGARPKWLTKMHYITRKKMIWKQTTVCVTGQTVACRAFVTELQGKFRNVCEQRPKRLLLLVNPISGGRHGVSNLKKIQPLFELAGITCDVKVSEREKHFEEMVSTYDFSTVNGVVIFGGDGSFSQVFNRLLRIAHEKAGTDYNNQEQFTPCTIPIGVIPSGTGNGIAAGLYGGNDPVTAALHIIKGHRSSFPVMGEYCESELVGYAGVVSGYGLFCDMMYYTDQQRWMRTARYTVMPLYTLLLKTHRLINAEITISNRKSDDGAKPDQQSEEEEKLSGDFTGIMIIPVNAYRGSSPSDHGAMVPGKMRAIIGRQTPRLDYLRMLARMYQQRLPEDGDFPTVLIRNATTIRIAVEPRDLGDKDFLNYLTNIDGEILTVKKADLTIKFLTDALQVYTSLPRENLSNPQPAETPVEP